MKFESYVTLYAYEVDYIDPGQSAGICTDTFVLDTSGAYALRRLGIPAEVWIREKYAAQGCNVVDIRSAQQRTALVDLNELWKMAAEDTAEGKA